MGSQQNALITEQKSWKNVGISWTAAITTPAVSARSYQAVKAIVPIITTDPASNALQLRFTGSTNGHSLVFDIYASRGQGDYFNRVATATCTVGQAQKGAATLLFVDTIALSNTCWPTSKIEAISPANDTEACVWLDTLGYVAWAIVPTTVNGTASADYSGV